MHKTKQWLAYQEEEILFHLEESWFVYGLGFLFPPAYDKCAKNIQIEYTPYVLQKK